MDRKCPIHEVQLTCGKSCSKQINYIIQKLNMKQSLLNADESKLIDNKTEGLVDMTPGQEADANRILKRSILGIFRTVVPHINALQLVAQGPKTSKNRNNNMDIMLTMVNSLINLADQMPLKYYNEMFVEIVGEKGIIESLNNRAALKFCSTLFSIMYYRRRDEQTLYEIEEEEESDYVEYGPILKDCLLKLYQTWLKVAGGAKCLQEVPHTIEDIQHFIREWSLEDTEQECDIWKALWVQLKALISQGKETFATNIAIDRESAVVLTEKVMLKMLAAASRVYSEDEQKELAKKCILHALKDKHCYLYDSLLNTKSIQLLQGTPRYRLLEIFTNGTLPDFRAYTNSSEGKGFLDEIAQSERLRIGNINVDPRAFLERKIRQLTFIELAGQCIRNKRHNNGEPNIESSISIDTLKEELELRDDSSVEEFIIDAIRTNMVKAKLSQSERKVIIHHAVPRQFDRGHWEELNQRLNNWKDQISKIHKGFDNIINSVAPDVFRNTVY